MQRSDPFLEKPAERNWLAHQSGKIFFFSNIFKKADTSPIARFFVN
tara:strand:- start:317 stop:454 length:138 start_codon:yes stop_codon:yes gene_type:complete